MKAQTTMMMMMMRMRTETTRRTFGQVLVLGDDQHTASSMAPGVEVVRCSSSRALRRRLASAEGTLVVVASLDELGDSESTQALSVTLTALVEHDAALVVETTAISSEALRGMTTLLEAQHRIQRSKIAAGKRQSKTRQGRPRLEFDLERACELRASGASLQQTADECGCSQSTVRRRLLRAA